MGRPRKDSQEARPFVKWAGGKAQLLEELLARLPERLGTYHEPFVGGGALFFRLRALGKAKKACLADANPELMAAYQSLRDSPEAVISELELLVGKTRKEDFYEIRAQSPDAMTAAQRTARLIYLNKMGFNGLYRVNRKGLFNVPFGQNDKAKILDAENLWAVHRALQGVRLELGSFHTVLKRAKAGDFVYFDPPYQPLSKSSSFTAYAKGGFGEAEQRHLARVVEELARRGVEVLLSNSASPLASALYEREGYEVARIDARRAINSKATGRGAIKELLVRVHARPPSERRPVKERQLSIDFAEPAAVRSRRTARPA
ncbi:MAG: DNA adenine methylase [Deltaproteobacteria bacterium]|nr:DNA adenine methylase [Deltaproteobacteria bacterium]